MIESSWIEVVIGVATILGSHWVLHRDIASLRERMARIEGMFEGFTGRRQES